MKIAVKPYKNIASWSNPEIANLLYFIYGPINQTMPINLQKVRYDEMRRLFNEVFVLSNIEEPSGLSFVDRYNELKNYEFDPKFYLDYVKKLQDASEQMEEIRITQPYKSKITPKENRLPFLMEFSKFGLETLRLALEIYESSCSKIIS